MSNIVEIDDASSAHRAQSQFEKACRSFAPHIWDKQTFRQGIDPEILEIYYDDRQSHLISLEKAARRHFRWAVAGICGAALFSLPLALGVYLQRQSVQTQSFSLHLAVLVSIFGMAESLRTAYKSLNAREACFDEVRKSLTPILQESDDIGASGPDKLLYTPENFDEACKQLEKCCVQELDQT